MSILGTIEEDGPLRKPAVTLYYGKDVAKYYAPPPPAATFGVRKERPLNSNVFTGPKLKLERAKKHIADLQAAVNRFNESTPYAMVCVHDSQTGERVFRLREHAPIPT